MATKQRILALQGGGMLGIGQAVIFGEMEKHLVDGRLYELFDLVGGTSVGSINAACLAIGLPAAQIINFFQKNGPQIFTGPRWMAKRLVAGCFKYDRTPLDQALVEHLGNATLADCKTKFIATSFEMGTGKIVYFQSYGTSYEDEDEIVYGPDSGWKLSEVCGASASAQTFFPGLMKDGRCYWDGGSTGQNAPDMLLLDEIADEANVSMLSIGRGRTPWPYTAAQMEKPSFKTALEVTIRIAYSGPEAAAVWQAKNRLGNRHLRLNPQLPKDFGIDDASGVTQASLMAAWLKCYDDNEKAIDDILA